MGIKNSIILRHNCGHVTHATGIIYNWGDGPWAVDDFKHLNLRICSRNIGAIAILMEESKQKK